MSRRKLKQRYQGVVRSRKVLGLLTPEQANQFEVMLARCHEPEEFEQVMDALRSFCNIHNDSDRYAKLVQEDPLGLED